MKTVILPSKMMFRGKPLTAAALLILVMSVFRGQTLTCHRAEYLIGNECCPMCPAGSRVKTDCTEFRNTACLPCVERTFMNQPTGRRQCFPCTNCDAGSGLKTKTSCTTTSDAVCEPLEGFYCVDSTEDGCVAAQKHTSCQPGQYIRQKGTALRDTECSDCSGGTDATFTSCQPHTQYESLNLQLTTAGTASAVSERRKDAKTEILVMSVFRGQTLTCQGAEYLIGNKCCPMCPAGSRVKTDCTEFRSTSCLPCVERTFMNQPTGLKQCFPCTNCDAGSGLKTKTSCTTTSDAVCEPLEGFYCVDSAEDGCAAAQKHTSCRPGQYIRQKGTALRDTECSDCSGGTFSDGTFTSCRPHTQCGSINLQLRAGTASADAECGEQSSNTTGTASAVSERRKDAKTKKEKQMQKIPNRSL
ncbi:uncharacterized protein LOC122883565 isoform X3 [Siniperca chuatsi]|uniref:uncharacterized protein LOC122883565 isoform X3 n=1 Tax=Siniperca chuatsi TaxID=119488 RepID=UPI001CE2243D|nr:uncharacterized protein LOC122883565 isoform X3 [Siniperca chuatsi]